MTRRDFLTNVLGGAVLACTGALVTALARFMQPNMLMDTLGPVEAGAAASYPIGSLTFVEPARAYLGRDEAGFYAIVAVCTHLGCTPRLDANAFVCPCHGSRLTRGGQVANGPAARPLDRAWVGRAADGNLLIDRSKLVDANFRARP